jgi:hypothetical protein
MLILKEYNLALTSSRLAISTHPRIGFVKTPCFCTMISFLVGLPPSIDVKLVFTSTFVKPLIKEENETRIWNDIFTTISRSPGNAVPIVAQKSLLGHSKGGSAAWQMAGLLQSVITGIIPGNRNSLSEYVPKLMNVTVLC